jgi:2-methylfumaryl-CoA isomerase
LLPGRDRTVVFLARKGFFFLITLGDRLVPIFDAAMARRKLADLVPAFEQLGVCWGPYQTLSQAAKDPRLFAGNPVFSTLTHPSGETYPAAGFAGTVPQDERQPARPAARNKTLRPALPGPEHKGPAPQTLTSA